MNKSSKNLTTKYKNTDTSQKKITKSPRLSPKKNTKSPRLSPKKKIPKTTSKENTSLATKSTKGKNMSFLY